MDDYLLKVGIDFNQADLNKVTGAIADEITSMGKVSDKFIKNALDTAKKYNDEIAKQEKIIADIERQLKTADKGDKATYQLLQDTKAKAESIRDSYKFGDMKKGLDSKNVVDALAKFAEQNKTPEAPKSFGQKYKDFSAGLDKMTGKVSAVAAVLSGVKDVIQKVIDQIGQVLDDFSDYANQLNPLSAFGSQSQKNLMARYGLTGSQAMGFSQVMSKMGISESDFGTMTESQRATFNSLNKFWNEGMAKLDPDKLERYTQTMAKYQEIQAKYDMGIQQVVLKLLSESPRFDEMVGKVGDLMDAFLDLSSSDAVQFVFDGFIDFFTALFNILEKGMRMLSKIPGFGGGGQSITNNTTNSNSTFNIYGSDFHSNDELARQLSYSSKGGYRG